MRHAGRFVLRLPAAALLALREAVAPQLCLAAGTPTRRRFAILDGFVGINRPHLAVDRIQLSLKLVLLIENRRTGTVEALTVDVGQLQPRDCRPDR